MTFIGSIILKLSLLTIAVGGVFIGRKCFHVKDDSFVEEVVEEVVKYRTGVDIDLSPESPEPDIPADQEGPVPKTAVGMTADMLNALADAKIAEL